MLAIKDFIDFSFIIAYLSGILSGIIIACLLYVLLVLSSLNKRRHIIESEANFNEEEVKKLIDAAKKNYDLLSDSLDENVRKGAFKSVVLNLISDIASKCFPNSKKPLYELSIDETILLSRYVIDRLDNLLDARGLRFFRRLSLVTVSNVLATKKKVVDNEVFKEAKKYSKLAKVGLTISSCFLAPVKIVKKGINSVKKVIIHKIMLVTIDIVGQEAYKVYTKQALKPVESELEKELLELSYDDSEEVLTK